MTQQNFAPRKLKKSNQRKAMLDSVIIPSFVAFCNKTGLKHSPTLSHSDFWFRPPHFHVVELMLGAVCCLVFYVAFARVYFARAKLAAPYAPKPPFFTDMSVGAALLLCVVAQIVASVTSSKSLLRESLLVTLLKLATPANLVSASWAYALLSQPSRYNYTEARMAASFSTLGGFGCVASFWFYSLVIYPESTSSSSIGRDSFGASFWYVAQHLLLSFAPHLWAANHGMVALTVNLLMTFLWLLTLFCVFVFAPAAYYTGTNVSYALYPPYETMERHFPVLYASVEKALNYYRFVQAWLLCLGALGYWAFVLVVDLARKRFREAQQQQQHVTTNTVNKKGEEKKPARRFKK